MSRGSSKPCPGCGEVKPYRPAKEVCRDCNRLLKRAKHLEGILDEIIDDKIIVCLGARPHWNEYIYTRSHAGSDLMDIFQRVAKSGSVPAMLPYYTKSEFDLLGKVEGVGREYVAMLKPLAEAIRDLRVAVGEALELEYKAGKADGHNLLMRLASGDLSINEFDKLTK